MKLIIDGLSVRIVHEDGRELPLDLSSDGLTVRALEAVELSIADDGQIAITVPFQDVTE
jgi:hypothetical protein